MKLTEDDIKICYSANIPILDDNDRFVLIHRYNPREAEDTKQQLLDDYQIRKVVEMRLDLAKTLKDDYMIQLFTDILRGR